jgi:hypothetical protein
MALAMGANAALDSLDVSSNGTVYLAGNIYTDTNGGSDAHVDFSGSTGGVVLTSNVIIDTDGDTDAGGGSISFQNSPISGNFSLSLDTNSNAAVTLDEVDINQLILVASTNILWGNITVDSAVDFSTAGTTILEENIKVTTSNDAVTFGAVNADGDGAATEGLEIQAGTALVIIDAVGPFQLLQPILLAI